MNYGIWIAGLIFTISLVPKCRSCPISKTADGLILANCSNLDLKELPKLPKDVQVADFSSNHNMAIKGFFMEEYSKTLIRLIMRDNLYASNQMLSGNGLDMGTFSKLTNLVDFEYSESDLYGFMQWKLAPSVKKYSVEKNAYLYVDVSWGSELEELNVNGNQLEALPKFHRPLPPLTILRAKKNPLNQITVLDIAPLCYLSVLELEFPKQSNLVKEIGFCNCTLLKEFASEYNITGISNLACFQATEAQKKACVNDTLIIQARKIRKSCPLLTKGELPNTLKTILKIVFFTTLFLLLLATLVLYIIRHFHLKQWWANYHHSQAISQAQEGEEEQSFQGEGPSISDGSLADEETPAS